VKLKVRGELLSIQPEADVTVKKRAQIWSAPAERSGDGALDHSDRRVSEIQSGVALRLPPHSKYLTPSLSEAYKPL
jgi:hypothetical protein